MYSWPRLFPRFHHPFLFSFINCVADCSARSALPLREHEGATNSQSGSWPVSFVGIFSTSSKCSPFSLESLYYVKESELKFLTAFFVFSGVTRGYFDELEELSQGSSFMTSQPGPANEYTSQFFRHFITPTEPAGPHTYKYL
jgi:hypothetical protein